MASSKSAIAALAGLALCFSATSASAAAACQAGQAGCVLPVGEPAPVQAQAPAGPVYEAVPERGGLFGAGFIIPLLALAAIVLVILAATDNLGGGKDPPRSP